jgi:PTS system nitrogen regulatory IIA component
MPLSDLLSQQSVIPTLRVNGKKQALQELAARAALITGLPEREIFDSILQRERLGSTGIGHGIAIPHCKLAGATRLFGLFARLEKPIDFEALDGEPVDLLFLLVAPEAAGADHLKALARVARVLRDPAATKLLRSTRDAEGLYALLTRQQAAA